MPTPHTLPVGTVLYVGRVYIRHGAKDYSPLSFRAHNPKLSKTKGNLGRFWAKLADVNKMNCKVGDAA